MKLKLVLAAVLSFTMLSAPRAANATELSLLAGLNYTKLNQDVPVATLSNSVGSGWVAGIGLHFPIFPLLAIEADALLENTRYENTLNEYSLSSVNFPIMLRYSFFPLFSIGVGPYFRFGTGDVTIKTKANSVETHYSYEDVSTAKSDFGGVVSLAVGIPLPFVGISAIGDARYYSGFKELYTGTTANTSYKLSGFQFLVGAQLSL
jgi:hypothetical protein